MVNNYMELDIGTLLSIIFGTFLFGLAIGELIERNRNKKSFTRTVNPIINDYRKQKKDMWKKYSEMKK